MIQQFMLGYSAVLQFYPPEGLPDGAVSLSLFDDSGTAWGDTANPISLTPDATTETITAAVVRGNDTLTIASPTGFVKGRYYIVILADGYWFECRVLAVGTTSLTLDEGVPVEVPANSTIRGYRCAHTLTANELDTVKRNIKALYTYQIDGQNVQHIERFDCVRDPFKVAISLAHMRREAADFGDFGGAANRWRTYIDGAHGEVDENLRARGVYPDQLQNREALRTAIVCGVLVRLHRAVQNPLAESYRAAMNDAIVNAIAGGPGVDTDDDGASDGARVPVRSRRKVI